MGDLDFIEEDEPVVHGATIVSILLLRQEVSTLLETKLWSNVTHVNVLQWFMSLQVTNLNNERVRTVTLAIDDELSHNSSIIGGPSKCTNPPL